MIFSHTWKPEKVVWKTIPIGNVVLDFSTEKILTKTQFGDIVRTNTGANRLTDFTVFRYTSFTDGSFLRFKQSGSELYLTTTIPQIKLNDINGISVTNSGLLAVTSAGNIVSQPKYPFTLDEINQVNATSPPNGDALTFIWHPFSYVSAWTPRPEASRLSGFDDVSNTPALHNVLAFNNKPINQGGWGGARMLPMDISQDGEPTLGADLDANGKTIYNINYDLFYEELSGTSAAVTVDIDTYSGTILECNTVKYLEVLITSAYLYKGGNITFHLLELRNFSGVIFFKTSGDIKFENGSIPILNTGGTTIFTLSVYLQDGRLTALVAYKAHNLTKFDNT